MSELKASQQVEPVAAGPIARDPVWPTHRVAFERDGERPLRREWLITNGTGAFAMGTAGGVNTRRYHALLIACKHPPVERVVALNQLLEQIEFTHGGQPESVDVTSCLFRDDKGRRVFSPRGSQNLTLFEKGLGVRWTYQRHGIELVRELRLHYKQQAATLRYRVRWIDADAAKKVERAVLHVSPMLTLRDFHSVLVAAHSPPFAVKAKQDEVTVTHDGTAVTMALHGGMFVEHRDWWNQMYYPAEEERGQEYTEDYFLPGSFDVALNPAGSNDVALTVALGDKAVEPIDGAASGRHVHLLPQMDHVTVRDEHVKRVLVIAADDFVVDRTIKDEKLSTILAGYPWFADWGRDTFIALPGLLLTTGRFDEARATLRTFAAAMKDGLVPNRFDDYHGDAAHYNTVDASLWFVRTALEYLEITKDTASWNGWLRDAAMQVIDAYLKGTNYDIRMGGDALISAGSASTQLTWMDAACDDVVFTPRYGKAVEINALWHHCLVGMAEAIRETDKPTATHYDKLAGRVTRSFLKVFWDDKLGYLRDHVTVDAEGNEHPDETMRPNQILAVSVPHSPLPRTKQVQVVEAVTRDLLTPFGLRTLRSDNPRYHGSYTGPRFQRDEAYHQGTIWPWLIGPYCEAVLRAGRFTGKAKAEARQALQPLIDQLLGDGLGQLHEIHEADPPHRPVGCIAQAWSVAEVFRALRLIEGG